MLQAECTRLCKKYGSISIIIGDETVERETTIHKPIATVIMMCTDTSEGKYMVEESRFILAQLCWLH